LEKKLSLLVIGGTGFFGKSILDAFKRGLLKQYDISKIIILARNTDKFLIEYPELISDGVEFINGDISKIEFIPNADFVIHAASSTNMIHYNDISNNAGKYNIEKAVSNYCRLATLYHNKSKILYCSSGAVYGKQPLNIETINEDFEFQQDLSSLSNEKQNYCLGKRFAENKIQHLGKNGLNVAIARCFAFSGKYLPKDQHYALGNFIQQAERDEPVIVKANGIIYRSYMEADQLVLSLIVILHHSSPFCPIYNVGSENQISLYDLAKNIANKYSVTYIFENYNDKIIIDRYVPNIDKLKNVMKNQNKFYVYK
jgi:dTDP-glucose 4,6-dehydratase